METYSLLREFADSWALLVLFTIFIGIFFWVMRPGANETHRDSAAIPFRHDDAPIGPEEDQT